MPRPGDREDAASACWAITTRARCSIPKDSTPAPSGRSSGPAINWKTRAATARSIDRRWDFLGALPRMHRDGKWLFVHGSPRNPVNEYVFPEDIYNQKKMEKLFSLVEFGCFQGHTHVPGVFTESRNFMTPDETGYAYQFEQQKFMCNVGSVGQPRDGDPRPCYVIQEAASAHVPPRGVRSERHRRKDLQHSRPRRLPGRSDQAGKIAAAVSRLPRSLVEVARLSIDRRIDPRRTTIATTARLSTD